MKTFFVNIWQLIRGFFTVFIHAFRHRVTLEYPEKRAVLNDRFRGCLTIDISKCSGCGICKSVCPCFGVINIEKTVLNDEAINSELTSAKPRLSSFSIDTAQCIFCGNCVQNCPNHALVMTQNYELANYDKKALKLVEQKNYTEARENHG